MKNLFLNCALTQQPFEKNEEIIVLPVTNIVDGDGSFYFGNPFHSTFNPDNPLFFNSLANNTDYKKVLSVLKSYLEDISFIQNKSPIEVAQAMAKKPVILHNRNRITGSIHPWQKHELNFIFVKKDEFLKRQTEFEKQSKDIINACFGFFDKAPYNNNSVVKIDVNYVLSKIQNLAGQHLQHLNTHFLRDFYIHHIFTHEKENVVRMNQSNFKHFIADFKDLIFVNSLYDTIEKNIQPSPSKNKPMRNAA